MKITEPWWYAYAHFRRPKTLHIGSSSVQSGGISIPLSELRNVSLRKTYFPLSVFGWSNFRLFSKAGSISIGVATSSSAQLTQRIAKLMRPLFAGRLAACATNLDELAQDNLCVYRPDRYVRASQAKAFLDRNSSSYKSLQAELEALKIHRLFPHEFLVQVQDLQRRLVDETRVITPAYRQEHNRTFLAHARVKEADFFKNVESRELTERQIDAALVFEDANLTVAGAGSGKSSCIVAKIGFALKTGLFKDEEILALSFNRNAADKLDERIEERLSKQFQRDVRVASKTFHSFGLATMVQCMGEGYRPKVFKEDEDEDGRLVASVLSELDTQDREFQQALTNWMLTTPFDEPQMIGGSTDIDECERRYERACRAAIRFNNTPKPAPNAYDGSIPTFDEKIYVRSLQERSIVNWLMLRGVLFKYEEQDWDGGKYFGLKAKNGNDKPYKPDFTYRGCYTRNGEAVRCRVVHEHFGLDANGRAPEWMGGEAYVKHAASKRAMFERLARKNSTAQEPVFFFETHSAQFQDGTIFDVLAGQLQKYGVTLQEPREEIRKRALESFREFNDLESLLNKFVLSFKNSGLTAKEVEERALRSANPHSSKLFLNVAFKLFAGYQNKLTSLGLIDFADMLHAAIKALRSRQVESSYRLILVDEFQDISRLRADLVKSVLDQAPGESIVFCVGDDWQTINRFAGSDVEVFKNVGTYFNREVASVQLDKTFRCPQGIADAARALVMQNDGQIDKRVQAHDRTVRNTIRVVEHGSQAHDRRNALESQLQWIAEINKGNNATTVYILRRTTHEKTAPDGLDTAYLKDIAKQFSPALKIEEKSVHTSKGLEASYVILPGLESGFAGFPDERQPQQMLELVLPPQKYFLEEERRLFYVGLTRAIKMAIVLTDSKRPSEFVQFLTTQKDTHVAIDWIRLGNGERVPCPWCMRGSMIPGWGRKSETMVCSRNFPCGYRAAK